MPSTASYWAAVRQAEATLQDSVMLISVEDQFTGRVGGVVTEAARLQAARLIAGKSHRIATAEEIAAYWVDQQARKQSARAAEMLRNGRVIVRVPAQTPAKKRP